MITIHTVLFPTRTVACLCFSFSFYILVDLLIKKVIKSLSRCKVYERNEDDKPTYTDRIWAMQILLCREKRTLFLVNEAQSHENHHYHQAVQQYFSYNTLEFESRGGHWSTTRSQQLWERPHVTYHLYDFATCYHPITYTLRSLSHLT